MFAFLNIIPLLRAHQRCRLQYGNESLVIANLERDLQEVLNITHNTSGIPTYKLKVFKEVFVPLFRTKTEPNKSSDGQKEEKVIALTTRELCDYFRQRTGKTITTNNLKQSYLNEFINGGLVDEEESVIDKRQKIYFPIVDLDSQLQQQEEEEEEEEKSNGASSGNSSNREDDASKIRKLSNRSVMDNFSQHPELLYPKNYTNVIFCSRTNNGTFAWWPFH